MRTDEKVITLEIVECEICLREIPISEAKMDEAADYVHHFCGLECYARWRAQEPKEKPGARDPSKKSVP
jgi:hypothetical protein